MDKRIILAVAGSGKTQYLIDKITKDSRILIVTYTQNNTKNLRNRIIKEFGYIPAGVRIYTYFSFIMSFCVKPIMGCDIKIKGITYDSPNQHTKRHTNNHYLNNKNRIYSCRIAKLIIDKNKVEEVSLRIKKYFDLFFIDEVQDFAANDFNFLCALAKTDIEILCVGDFYQHTFDTSNDGNTQRNLYNNKNNYLTQLQDAGFKIDEIKLSYSYRCSPTICNFITKKLGIKINSHREDSTNIKFLESPEEIDLIMKNNDIAKLFFRESNKYIGWTDNWGNTKGLDDFEDICIILNNTTHKHYIADNLLQLAHSTLNKLYVAFTRAKGNVYLIPQKKLNGKYKKPDL